MLFGPVFNVELMTTARRARYYFIRFLYGSIILFQIYVTYQSNEWRIAANGGRLNINEMSGFAKQLFTTFAVVQAVVVLLLTPALVGGTIADERQRKTLHYLLTSQLSSAEIILGKLGARLLQIVVLVALGLPVVSLMSLFGGIDIPVLLFSYAGTITTMFFVASASILVSVVSRRPREAISVIYILEIAWLLVPTVLMNSMAYGWAPWPEVARIVNPYLQYIAMTSPVYLIAPPPMTGGGVVPIPMIGVGINGLVVIALWGMGLQIVYGAIFVLLASFRLRPSARSEGSVSAVNKWFTNLTRKRKWLPRKPCGDDAMLWKELHVSRTGGIVKVLFVLLGLALVGLIIYTMFEPFVGAYDEMGRDGYFTRGRARTNFSGYLRGFTATIYVLWFLGIASASATGLCSEREEDQWLTLTSTPLGGLEILRSKMIGPVWGLRLLAYLMFVLWGFGLMVGSIHPLAVIACLIEFAVFTWFLTAIGTFFSLRAKNSTRALASTMATLIFLNGAYMFCCIPFRPDTPMIAAGCTPFIFTVSLFNSEDLYQLAQDRPYMKSGETIATCVLGVLFYAIAAAGLTASVFSMFDAVVDRPDRLRQNRTPHQQREFLTGGKGKRWQDDLS